jgi:hypothetical protein
MLYVETEPINGDLLTECSPTPYTSKKTVFKYIFLVIRGWAKKPVACHVFCLKS